MALGVNNLTGQPELRRRIFWTVGLLVAFRVGTHIPVPGINPDALASFFASIQTIVGMLNMLSGGGLERFSVVALGIMPYITASIIMQLLQVLVPDLKRMAKEEGSAGRRKITQYTRYGTVLITLVQGFAIAVGFEKMQGVVIEPGWTFRLATIITLMAGTVLLMWLGEQITERGIGNGISLIIFSGIVANAPGAIIRLIQRVTDGDMSFFGLLLILLVIVAVMGCIVFMERAQRRIPIHYAKRQVGRKMYGGQTTHLPLRINTSGVIPPIFASSLLSFPAVLGGLSSNEYLQTIAAWFTPGSPLYMALFVVLIVFFCFFYTAIIFDPKDIAENLKKGGGFVPGIRPGEKTQEYLDKVLARLTLWGAVYVSLVCVFPTFLTAKMQVPLYFGGTSLLIVVGVAIDFQNQIQSHMISRQYEGYMQKGRKS